MPLGSWTRGLEGSAPGAPESGPPPPDDCMSIPTLPLEGTTCRLRRWRREDAESLARHADDLGVWRNLRDAFPHPYTLEDAHGFLGLTIDLEEPHNLAIEVEGQAYQVLERSRWDRDAQRLHVTYVHVLADGLGEAVEGLLPQRYLLSSQIPSLCARAGLVVERLASDFSDAPHDPDGPLLVVHASLDKSPCTD